MRLEKVWKLFNDVCIVIYSNKPFQQLSTPTNDTFSLHVKKKSFMNSITFTFIHYFDFFLDLDISLLNLSISHRDLLLFFL